MLLPSLLAISLACIMTLNEINVLKTRVALSQRNGKDNAKIKYCRCIAWGRLKEGSIVNNLELEK